MDKIESYKLFKKIFVKDNLKPKFYGKDIDLKKVQKWFKSEGNYIMIEYCEGKGKYPVRVVEGACQYYDCPLSWERY